MRSSRQISEHYHALGLAAVTDRDRFWCNLVIGLGFFNKRGRGCHGDPCSRPHLYLQECLPDLFEPNAFPMRVLRELQRT
jgi:hypothetical protein